MKRPAIHPLPSLVTLLALLLGTLSGMPAAAQSVALVGARIIDGSGDDPIENGALVLDGGRIAALGPRDEVDIPAGLETVDLEGKTLMPGLVNAHGHAGDDTEQKLETYARYGVTTVLSLGGGGEEQIALRDAQQNGDIDGRARLFLAGPVVNSDTPEAAETAVDERADMGVDWIKFRIQDGNVPEPVYAAIIRQGHARGLPVAGHMYHQADAKGLTRRGIDLLAHSVRDQPVDDEYLSLVDDADICLTPTLTRELSTYVYEERPDFFDDPFFTRWVNEEEMEAVMSEDSRRRARANAEQGRADLAMAQENLAAMVEAGLPIAMGTDSGAFPGRFVGYFEHLELELMAEAGMSPMAIIESATGMAAACIGLEDELGTLAPGKRADFLVLDADPLEDIRNIREIETVWINGEPLDAR